MRILMLANLLLLGILVGQFTVFAQTGRDNNYQIYALSYGVFPGYPISNLVAGADKDRKLDLQMMIWLVRIPAGKNILVDTGCYHDKFVKDLGLKSFIKPSDALAKLGMKPEDITDVIITHLHWDHADGMDLFPNAKIWIQNEEYLYYAGAAWQPGGKSGGIDQDDVLTLVKLNMAHRVNLVDGDGKEIIDGITVYTGGRHTFASQYVGVKTVGGTYVIASDNMYLYENLQKHVPITQTFDAVSNLKAQDRMKQIASRPEMIIPGHDPEVFVRYPKPGNGVAKIQ
jgi:glyoxylase-like metal-dependent hydrolase (beta-lactamase superfamily II)